MLLTRQSWARLIECDDQIRLYDLLLACDCMQFSLAAQAPGVTAAR
jgi:hypothetical protein